MRAVADLHQQLLDLIAEYRTSADADDYPVRFPLDALRAVVELHAPDDGAGYARCDGCLNAWGESAEWPCSTVQAIARELGVQEDNHG